MKVEFSTLSQYLEYLQSQGRYSFLRNEAIVALHLTENAFKKAAYRLMLKHKLNRIRNDFYTIVPPEYIAYESLPVSWFIDDMMRYFQMPYYCGILTAASLLGVAHQQPMTFQVVTDTTQVRPIRVRNLQIEFHYKKLVKSYFYLAIQTPTGTMNVSTPEVTAFDLINYIRAAGHINNVATVLCELAPQLHAEKLAELIEKGDVETAVVQRLCYLLDSLKLSADLELLEKVLKNKNPIYRPLVTGVAQPVIERNKRWHILVNETVEPDEL